MKTNYKYIHFVISREVCNGKKVWECRNNKTNHVLAEIFWYKPWEEWCFTQADKNIVFNSGCLKDTIDFINQLTNNEPLF
jgi:hypothetical protein